MNKTRGRARLFSLLLAVVMVLGTVFPAAARAGDSPFEDVHPEDYFYQPVMCPGGHWTTQG